MPKDKEDDFKFGIEDMADFLGIEPASVRIKLRNAKIAKKAAGGTRYGWKTKGDMESDGKTLKETKAAAPKKEAKAPKKAEKPAKAKKADKKASKKAA